MAHVHAAAALLPRWRTRGGGHLLVTASAAGLLTNLGDAPYSVTKHAAVAFAEWVAITHGHEGVGVTCLCPQGVRTPMVLGAEADEFAACVLEAAPAVRTTARRTGTSSTATVPSRSRWCAARRSSNPQKSPNARSTRWPRVGSSPSRTPRSPRYEQARATDHDRWIIGMRRLQAQLDGADRRRRR